MSSDTYSWIGSSGGPWGLAANWADTTAGQNPATSVPGTNNPVVIAGPTGSIYEVIAGGGTAASIALTGLIDLTGTYATGPLTIGTVQAGTSSFSGTAGNLELGSVSAVSASVVTVADGALSLNGGGVALTASGSITIGTPSGYQTSSSSSYFNGAAGTVSVAGGATITAGGDLIVAYGSVSAQGGGTELEVGGDLLLGTPNPTNTTRPYANAEVGNLSVANGATVAIAGGLVEYYGYYYGSNEIDVSGAGSKLSVAGTATFDSAPYYQYLYAQSGGAIQFGSLSLINSSGNSYYTYLSADAASSIEIGTTGGAAIGAITVDAGATVAAVSAAYLSSNVVDNGLIDETGSSLTVSGTLSGAGTVEIGTSGSFSVNALAGTTLVQLDANAAMTLNGTAAAGGAIDFEGAGATLTVGAADAYNSQIGGYAYVPYAVDATLSGFATADTIVFNNITLTSAVYTYGGNNTGTLALYAGSTLEETLTLAGDYASRLFFVAPTASGGSALVTNTTGSGPVSPNTDTYSWIGASGGSWGSPANWADTTAGQNPANAVPGTNNPVTIAGPAGSVYEVIAGGGTAASIALTGLIDLAGTYATGPLTIGAVQLGTASATGTAGDLVLDAGSAVSASTVAVTDGSLSLNGGGVALTASGSMTIGTPSGYETSSSSSGFNGAGGTLSVAGGATVSAGGDLIAAYGSVSAQGGGTELEVGGDLVLGTPNPANTTRPYANAEFGDLSVANGATVAVAGGLVDYYGYYYSSAQFDVTGAGSKLTVAGTATFDSALYYQYLYAQSGGAIQFGGLSLINSSDSSYYAYLYADAASSIEIGTAGSAAAGAITVDAGAVMTASAGTELSGNVADNGLIDQAGGSLTMSGTLSGTGTVQIGTSGSFSANDLAGTTLVQLGSNAAMALNGTAAAGDTIAFDGTGATLTVAAIDTYNSKTATYAYVSDAVDATLSGFATGDAIVFNNVTLTNAAYTYNGNNTGTLALDAGTTAEETLALAGDYTAWNFVLSPSASGGTALEANPGGGSPPSTTTDAYSWIGASGGSWGSASNWADVTAGENPAPAVPGTITPVTIAGPTSSAYEVIAGGGTAASIALTGSIDLAGSYTTGTLTIGSLQVGTSSVTGTSGNLGIGAGSAVSASTVALEDGALSLNGGGVALAASGSITIGTPSGYETSSSSSDFSGAAGTLSVAGGATLAAQGDLIVADGSVVAQGSGTTLTVNDGLTLGTPSPASTTPPYTNAASGELSIESGAIVAIAGGLTDNYDNVVSVSGAGSELTVAGTATTSDYQNFYAQSGGAIQLGGLSLINSTGSGYYTYLYTDGASSIEIGTTGSAAAGATTVDAGVTVSSSSPLEVYSNLVNNGLISQANGSLSVGGTLSGIGTVDIAADGSLSAGTLSGAGTVAIGTNASLSAGDLSGTTLVQLGTNAAMALNGTAAAGDTIDFDGTGAALTIGATERYDPSTATDADVPYAVSATLSGFATGDTIVFNDVALTSAAYAYGGNDAGSLALYAGTTLEETLTLAGDYTSGVFFVAPTTSGGSVLVTSTPGSGLISTSSDAYSWIGAAADSGSSWNLASNWADTTAGQNPATAAPGAKNAVTISGPSGSIYEVIAGGGTVASIALTGLIDLAGTYATGPLTIGAVQVGTSSVTGTAGSLALVGDAAVSASTVSLEDGALNLNGGGVALTASGSITIGTPSGYETSSSSSYFNGAAGTVSVAGGATITAGGDLIVAYGSVSAQGGGTELEVGGDLVLGTPNPTNTTRPYANAEVGNLSVANGATVAIAGGLIEYYGYYYSSNEIDVSGAGSKLTVAGTATFDSAPYYQYLYAQSGGAIQFGGLSLINSSGNSYYTYLYTDAASSIEIGTTGGAAIGAITVDAGVTVSAVSAAYLSGNVVDNGLIDETGRSLTVSGTLSGTGTVEIGANGSLSVDALSGTGTVEIGTSGSFSASSLAGAAQVQLGANAAMTLNGTAAAGGTIDFEGSGATLTIGAAYAYNSQIGSYAYDPYAVGATLSGFATGDTIVLNNVVLTNAVYNYGGNNLGTLALYAGSTLEETLTLAGDYSTRVFFISPTTNGSSPVSLLAQPIGTVPGNEAVLQGVSAPIAGISVTDPNAQATGISVTLTAITGQLSAGSSGGGTVTGSGTGQLTFSGTVSQVNADLTTLTYVSGTTGTDTIAVNTTDSLGAIGLQATVSVTVLPISPPTIALPAGPVVEQPGAAGTIGGLSITYPDAAVPGEQVTVTVTDTVGTLAVNAATPGGGGTVEGSGTEQLSLAGTLPQVNAELGTLSYLSGAAGTDTLTIGASGTHGGTGTSQTLTVLTAGRPIISAPTAASIAMGAAESVGTISISETPEIGSETFTITVMDVSGTLAAVGSGVSGSGSRSLTISGSLAQVNSDLAGLTDSATAADTITIGATDSFGASASAKLNVTVLQDTTPPTLTAALSDDTGISPSDGITSDDTIVGSLIDSLGGGGIASLKGGLDGTPAGHFADLTSFLQPDGSFRLDPSALQTLVAGVLPDGPHVLHLVGVDQAGNSASIAVAYTLETVSPATPVFNVPAGDLSGPPGTELTQMGSIDLVGTTSPGAIVTLAGTALETTAGDTGAFDLSNVALAPGTNTLTLEASDAAGNLSAPQSLAVVREAITVGQVTAPADVVQSAGASIGYELDLAGLSGLTGQIQIAAYLSPDGQLSDAGPAVAQTTLSLADLAGATSYDGQLSLPASVFGSLPFGDYHAVITATGTIDGETGQLASSAASTPLVYEPGYSAQITSPDATVVAGGSTMLSGVATSATDGTPVPYVPVDVTISSSDFQETLSTTTDATGAFAVDFQPLVGAEGLYDVAAYNPGLSGEGQAPEATVDVVGLAIADEQVSIDVPTGIATTGTIVIDNLSDLPLDGITSTVDGLPAGWSFTLNDLPATLAANSQTVVHYTLDATTQSDLSTFTVNIAAADGAQDSATFSVASQQSGPDLQVDASGLTTGILSGGQTLLTFTITNEGQQAAEDVRLSLPPGLSWLQSASAQNLGSIGPGGSMTVSLLADPGADVALGEYQGTIGVQYGADSGQNPTTSVPFDLTVTTDQTGSVALTISDEATILASGPLVQDATVILTNASGDMLATYTDVNGSLQIPDLAVGTYTLQISAAGHSSDNQTIQIAAGQTDSVAAFLPMQVATYSWSVVPSTVTDTYSIVLTSTFETNVPVPVVTVNPPILDFSNLGYGQSEVIDLTMTNHGLIAANDVSLDLPNPPGYVITPLVNNLPEIAADSSVLVPVTITRLLPVSSGGGSATSDASVTSDAGVVSGASAASDASVTSDAIATSETSDATPVAGPEFTVVSPIDISSIPGLTPPPSIDATDWGLILDRLQTLFGTTAASANAQLAAASEVLTQIGEPASDASTVLAYDVEQAAGLLPDITLADTTDIAESGTGLDLSLTRVYSASFLNRNDAGAFGDGWTYTFGVTATTDASGNVYITSPSGTEVFNPVVFSPLVDGGSAVQPGDLGNVYASQPGDSSVLTQVDGAFVLTDASGTVERFLTDGQLSSITDSNGNSITVSYNSAGVISGVTDTNGQSLSFTTNAEGRITSTTDQSGQTVTYTYDASGDHLLSVSSPAGTTSYSYSTDSNPLVQNALTQVTNPDGTTQSFGYDSQGDLSSQSGPGGVGTTTYSYGATGIVTETDPAGNTATLVYDPNGNLVETIDPSGNVTNLQYDSNGDVTGVASPGGGSDQFSYDANGNLLSYTDPDGGVVTATYAPGTDELTSLTDQNGDTTQYSYDSAGDLTGITQADGTGTTYQYAANGALTEMINATGQTIQYSYNAGGLLTGQTFSNGTSESYAYDAQGDLISATATNGGVTNYTYNAASELTSVTNPQGQVESYSYNSAGQETQRVEPDGSITNYSYNTAGALAELTDGSGNLITQYTYNSTGQLVSTNDGNGAVTNYTYDALGDVTEIQTLAADGSVTSQLNYAYDVNGQPITATSLDGTWTYSYDASGQLVHAVFGSTNASIPNQDLSYAYDAAGNRTQTIFNGAVNNYTTNNLNQYTSSNGTTYAYDADGNLITTSSGGQTTTYSYNVENQLVSETGPDGTTSYSYDALGNLVSTTVNGVTSNYVIDPLAVSTSATGPLSAIAQAYNTAGQVTATYDYGDGLAAQITNNGTYYYNADATGNITSLSGPGGNLVDTYDYTPFGSLLASTGSVTNPFEYSGEFGVTTGANGLVAMRARYYDSATGRFISEDTTGLSGGSNLYTYGDNNPVAMVDPTGEFAILLFWAFPLASAAIGGLAEAITAAPGHRLQALYAGAVSNFVGTTVEESLALSGGLAGLVLGGAANGALTYAIDQELQGQPIDPKELGALAVIGAATAGFSNILKNTLKIVGANPKYLSLGKKAVNEIMQFLVSNEFGAVLKKIKDILSLPGLSFPAGTNPTDCPTYIITSGGLAYSYFCIGTETVWVSIGYNAVYTVTPPCAPGPGGTWISGGGGGGGGGAFGGLGGGGGGGPGASYTFVSTPVASSSSIHCANPSEIPFYSILGSPNFPNGSTVLTYTTSFQGIGVTISIGLEAQPLSDIGAGAGLVNDYFSNKSQANLAAAQTGMEQAASAGFQLMSSEVGSLTQSSTQTTSAAQSTSDVISAADISPAPVDISAIMGSAAVQALQGVLDGSTFLDGLGEILQSLNGVPVDGGPTQDESAVDYTNLESVQAALSPLLGPRFSGLVNLQTFANFELNQINFQTYLLGNIGFFDTSDATGLQNFLTYVAAAFAAGQPITNASAVPVPSDIDPALLPAFITRFNLTLQYWSEGIFNTTDVPTGQSQDFIALDTLSDLYQRVAGSIDQSDAALSQTVATDQAMVTSVLQAATQLEIAENQSSTGTCATVKVEIDQTAVVSRSAFTGTLTIDPNIEMDNLSVNLVITDQNGNVVDPSTFGITTTLLTGISALDGTQTIEPGDEVTAQYTFIPSLAAAPSGPTEYNIGGTISSNGPAGDYTTDLAPVTITVLPQPDLVLDYFLQRNVVGYDPNMPNVVTPPQPFVLGLQVHNIGAGDADNLTIVSAQPQIVDNEKGLDIAFSILGSQVNGAAGSPSLTVNLGNVAAGTTDTAAWFLESSLQGQFIDYTASFTNLNPLGLTESSIIQTVNIYEMIHAGDVDGDGVEDFLTSDNPASLNAPDTLWLSNGTTDPVRDIASTAQEEADQNGTITVEVLTPAKAAEWDYFNVLVPADDSYSVASVTRADGTALLPGQYWFTDRTFTNASVEPVYENSINILDDEVSAYYTVTFVENPAPGVGSITIGLTNDTGASPVDGITSDDEVTGLGAPNAIVQLTIDGTLSTDTAAADATGEWSFTPTGLADGTHTIVASETDAAGNTGSASLTFTLATTPPAVTETLQAASVGSTGTPVVASDALTGTGDPDATVQFVIDGTTVARTATADANGVWNFTPVGLAPGVHTIVASEADLAGNTGLASLTFTLEPSPLAEAAVISAIPFVLPDARVSTTDVAALSIANAAAAPAEDLDVAIGGVTGNVMASGTISLLAADTTDTSSISVGLDTAGAGVQSGTVVLAFASDGMGTDGNGTTALQSQTVAVSGSVFRLADAAVGTPLANPIVHVGDTAVLDLPITNTAANDGFSENLRVAIAQTTGEITAQAPIGEISAGGSGVLTYGVPTAEAGLQTGTVTLDFASDGSGIDGYAATPDGTQVVALSAMVDNYAAASVTELSGSATLISGATTDTLNLGTVALGGSPIDVQLGVENIAAGPADLLEGSFSDSGASEIGLSGFNSFTGIAAGQTLPGLDVVLNTGTAGSFTHTITLAGTGYNASGYSGTLVPQVVTITGTVDPGPIASNGSLTVAFGESVDVTALVDGLVTPGLAGDTETITSVTGDASLSNGHITYTPTAVGSDSFGYTVTDELGDVSSGAVAVTVIGPSISGTAANQPTNDETPINSFANVTIADNGVGQIETVTVTPSSTSDGALEDPNAETDHATIDASGAWHVTGSAAQVTSAIEGLIFVPGEHQVAPGQAIATSFTIADSDTAGASTTDTNASVIATAVKDTPTITGALSGQMTTYEQSIAPFTGVSIGDVDFGQTETVTVTLNSAANGTLSRLGGGSYDAATGSYTDTGTAAAVTAALDGLVFIPTVPEGSSGQTVTTGFAIDDTDTAGASVSDTTTTVIVGPPATTVISDDLGTSLVQVGSRFFLWSSSGQGPALQYGGGDVIAGEFGDWTPIGAIQQSSGGYLVAWQSGIGASAQYTVWDTEGNGNYLDSATGAVSGSNFALEELELSFGQDLNGDGTIGPGPVTKTIQTDDGTSLVQIGSDFALRNGGGIGPALQYQGSAVTVGEFGAWTPIGAVQQSSGGYLIAWQSGAGASAQYTVWDTDNNGNYLSSAMGAVSGSNFVFEELELTFGQDLNGDGTIGPGPVSRTIQTDDGTSLVQIGNDFALRNSSGIGPVLQYLGNAVTVGEFGAWTPIGAVQQSNGGYLVAWQSGTGASAQYVIWETDSNGNYTGSATGTVAGSSIVLQELELQFNQDLNNDGTTGPAKALIATDNGTSLFQVADEFALDNSGGAGPTLQYHSSAVTVGEFGAWTPIGAVQQSSGGYLIAWQSGAGASAQYTVWDTDNNGNYLSNAMGAVSGSNFVFEELELTFGQDLNGDGTIGPGPVTRTIQTDDGTSLVQIGNDFALRNSSGIGPVLQYLGNAVTVGEFGAWTPIGAVQQSNGGYLVAWRSGTGASAQYVVWETDSNGNYSSSAMGAVSGSNFALEELELTFGQDLNGDGTIGPVMPIAPVSGTSVALVGDRYVLDNSSGSGPFLMYQSSAATVGEFGGWTPIAAVQTASGYLVAWQSGIGASVQYTVWNTDSNGNYLSSAMGAVSGSNLVLEELELTFGQDLNGDGTIGPGPVTKTIQTDDGTSLVQIGSDFAMRNGSGIGPVLQYYSSAVTVGEFGAWTPIGAVQQSSGGYLIAWQSGAGASAQYTVWDTDNNGNYLSSAMGAVSGSNFAFEELELTFGQDLNGDGTIGPGPVSRTIQTDDGTSLVQIVNDFALRNSSGSGPALQYQGNAVTVGEFGAWTPIGAVQPTAGGGYLVAWQSGTGASAQYVVWETDSNGNYTGSATGAVAGSSIVLQEAELQFNQDLNDDGTKGPAATPIATDNGTSLYTSGDQFFLGNSSGTGTWLSYQGSAVTAGEFGGWTPIGAVVQSGGGYLIAWRMAGQDQYVIWNTDSNGSYLSSATAAVSGEDFSLEDLEPVFGQNLNGEGTVSTVLDTTTGAGGVLNLTGKTAATTINLGENTASVSAGLNAPSLSFLGTPDAITLGSGAAKIEYTLAQTSGIETIANFVYGQDELNIDLQGSASGLLQAYDTTVDGVHAIAIASSADLTHGVVLLNMTGGQTAANLLASHTTFIGGHALVS